MESQHPITLVLADDHGIVREGIAAYCKTRPEILIIGQCSNGEEALETILAREPDFAVIDLNMPKANGLEVVRRVRLGNSRTKLIILSVSRDEGMVRELFRSGADGYVLKDGPARHLFEAINYIQDGGQYLSPLLRRDTLQENSETRDPLALLSKREYDVFGFLVNGMRPKDIAKTLEISPKTVDTYRANIMRKLEVDGIAGLVRFAIERNLNPASIEPNAIELNRMEANRRTHPKNAPESGAADPAKKKEPGSEEDSQAAPESLTPPLPET
jgi:DNA-binding NarL/FixJ family response regulator